MSDSGTPKDDPSQLSLDTLSESETSEDHSQGHPEQALADKPAPLDEPSKGEVPIDKKLESLAAEFSEAPIQSDTSLGDHKKNKSLWLLLVVLLLVLAGGGAIVVYYANQLLPKIAQIDDFDQRISVLSSAVAKNQTMASSIKSELLNQTGMVQKQFQSKVESEISNADNSFRSLSAKNQQQVDMLQKRVDGHQQRLLSLSTTSREDWMLAEAEYLLKLANQRVLLERTTDNAVALLESADQLVGQVSAGTGDAELFAIRKAISRDLTALKLIESVDKDGVYLKLQALGDLVEHLPRVPNHTFTASPGSPNSVDTQTEPSAIKKSVSDRFWEQLQLMIGSLDQYIKIEDSTAPVKPLVDQHFTQVASLNVRLLVEQAQIALLKESPVIYVNSLNKAHELIDQYYIQSQAASEYKSAIKTLSELQIAPELPNISNSLKLLHGYIRQLHKIENVKEGQL